MTKSPVKKMKITQVVEVSTKVVNVGNATNAISNGTKRKVEPVEMTENPVKKIKVIDVVDVSKKGVE